MPIDPLSTGSHSDKQLTPVTECQERSLCRGKDSIHKPDPHLTRWNNELLSSCLDRSFCLFLSLFNLEEWVRAVLLVSMVI